MIYFIEIDPATGKVLFSGSAEALEQVPGFHPDKHKAVDAPVVDVNSVYWDGSQCQPIGARPSPGHRFCFDRKAWIPCMNTALAAIRAKRDRLLAASDWVTLRSNDLGEPPPPEWRAYRQALRDLTKTCDPLNIIWPVAPQG